MVFDLSKSHFLSPKRHYVHYACSTYSEKPFNVSTMVWVWYDTQVLFRGTEIAVSLYLKHNTSADKIQLNVIWLFHALHNKSIFFRSSWLTGVSTDLVSPIAYPQTPLKCLVLAVKKKILKKVDRINPPPHQN